MEQLQYPLAVGQQLGTQLCEVAFFDVRRERQIEHMLFHRELEFVFVQGSNRVHDLAVVQTQFFGDWRFYEYLTQVEGDRRDTRDLVDALRPEQRHGMPFKGNAPSFYARSCSSRWWRNHLNQGLNWCSRRQRFWEVRFCLT